MKSTIGGLISIIVVSVVMFFVWYLGYDIVYKQNPIVLMKEENKLISSQHQFNNNTAFIGLLVESEDVGKVDELFKILSFKLTHYLYKKNTNLSSDEIWEIESKEIKLVPCTGFWNYNQSYTEEQLSQFLCGENFDYSLGGYWTEEFLNLLVYEVHFCNSNIRSDCLPMEDMKLFVKGKYLNLYFMDQIVDPTNFETPIKYFSRNIYMLLDSLLYKEMELFFKTIEIDSDVGFFIEDKKYFTSYQFDRFTVDSKSLDDEEDPMLASIWVYSSSKKVTYKRSYIKVQDIAANVGGIVKFMMLSSYLLLYLPSMKAIKVKIMNEIFDFNFDDNIKIIPPSQMKTQLIKEEDLSYETENSPSSNRKQSFKSHKTRKESIKLKTSKTTYII